MSDPVAERLARIEAIQGELETILQTLILNDSTIIDALAQMLGAIQQIQGRAEDAQQRLADEIQAMGRELARLQTSSVQKAKPTPALNGSSAVDPEIPLLEYLYSFVAHPVAIDIGANKGQFTERLLEAGYTVYAFEPFPPAFAELSRLGHERLHLFQLAAGAADGAMDLHLARNVGEGAHDASLFSTLAPHPLLDDCVFDQTISVPVRSLASLRQHDEIPSQIGVLKIDSEGFDLEVIRGIGDAIHPEVVVTEYWDGQHPFGREGHGALAEIVTVMRRRGYPWHLTINHLEPPQKISFSCNRMRSFPGSWGNVLFFRDHSLFIRALDWCESALEPARAD